MSRSKRNSLWEMNINIEDFIYEVQQRPALWDLTSPEYTDAGKKKDAWEELARCFYDKTVAQKFTEANFCSQLQKKWKNLRDCFSRELKIRRRSSSNSEVRKSSGYIYFNQLSFLEGSIIPKVKNPQSLPSVVQPQEEQQEESSSTINIPPPVTKKHKKNIKVEQNPICSTSGLKTSCGESIFVKEDHYAPERDPEVDCDRMFLLSLLDPLKQIPEYARFGVKRKLMTLLDNELQAHVHNLNPEITITDAENFMT